jgi:signal transduction histidine kinase
MDEKLVPAHIHFTKWFIRIRWIAIGILIAATIVVKYFFEVDIQAKSIFILSVVLLLLNILHRVILRYLKKDKGRRVIQKIKREIHFQIITDLIILTLILHFSGGVENPIIIFYFFHMIIASSIFSAVQSYSYSVFTIILAGSLSLLEYFGVVPHYPLTGFAADNLYVNIFYILGSGFVFTITSVLIVFLSHMIISRSIKTEETYVRTNQELENKDKLKNEYVLRVTHDIKGHVAAISSCVDVIRTGIAGPLNEVQKEFSDRAYDRTELLSTFIKNLLNLTRKRLRHDIGFEEFRLKDVIDKVIEGVQPLAAEKSIALSHTFDNNIKTVRGDPFTIEELLSNLLLNAVKYTPRGGRVSMTVRRHSDNIIYDISDSGIGIPKDETEKIFDEFYRASNVPRDIKTGSGLGLAIVKQIVDNHRGTISVNSEPGIWTKFTVILPVNPGMAS